MLPNALADGAADRHTVHGHADPSDGAIAGDGETCPICGMVAVVERRCKVVCTHCRTILQSCADL
jgi:hypothetical protein